MKKHVHFRCEFPWCGGASDGVVSGLFGRGGCGCGHCEKVDQWIKHEITIIWEKVTVNEVRETIKFAVVVIVVVVVRLMVSDM
jgi:hypothetical protein